MRTVYRIARHDSGTCWLIFMDEELFTTCQTRREARELVRRERALDAELAKLRA